MAQPVSGAGHTHTNGLLLPSGQRREAPDGALRRRTAEVAGAVQLNGAGGSSEKPISCCCETLVIAAVSGVFALTMTGLLSAIAYRLSFR